MSMKEYVRKCLREEVLSNLFLVEAKDVGEWWDGLSGKKVKTVIAILGLNKGRASASFSDLAPEEQAEIGAYYKKHKGKVESIDGGDDVLDGDYPRESNWKR